MSTRCQILVEGQHGTPVYVYRHSDGYPDTEHGVLATLKPLCEDFLRWRGFDPSYLVAHILADQIRIHTEHNEEYYRKDSLFADRGDQDKIEEGINMSKYIGFGADTQQHSDIEYLYIVRKTGIEVKYLRDWRSGDWVTDKFVEFEINRD